MMSDLLSLRPWCNYFDPPGPGDPPDVVMQDPHDAADGLYFFVPVADGAAVRVAVCEAHAEVLRRQFGGDTP
jgi:hypothetical protein